MGSKLSKSQTDSKITDDSLQYSTPNNNTIINPEVNKLSNEKNTDTTLLTGTTAETISQEINNVNNKISNNKEEIVPYKFEWNGTANEVKIAGSFIDNWENSLPMIKNNEKNNFEIILNLPKKIHFFKFIVDNKWIISDKYQSTKDISNNLNNFIDLVNYIPPIELLNNQKTLGKKEKSKDKKNNYDCKYPSINELNVTTPKISGHYKPSFNLDYRSNQNIIKKFVDKDYLIYDENNILSENTSYKKILQCPHEKLSHICSCADNLGDQTKKYMKFGISVKNKHKVCTIIYYKPKKI